MAEARSQLLKNYKYTVAITGGSLVDPTGNGISAGFSNVSGLSSNVEVIEYREGTDPSHSSKRPGRPSYGDVTFERGVTFNGFGLSDWHEGVKRIMEDEVGVVTNADIQATVTITVNGEGGVKVAEWKLYGAFPNSLEIGDLAADGSETLVETAVFSVESLTRTF